MELRHLRYVIAVAEEGHITRAAERLSMQQPPLSRQIKAIERELGVQLFRRKPRGVEPTPAGRAFVNEARAMLSHLERAGDLVRRTARGEQGQISVGYTSLAAFHPLVPRIIREFRAAFPLVSVTLAEDLPSKLVERTRGEDLDVAFVQAPIANPDGLVINQMCNEPMVLALPKEHRLARTRASDAALALAMLVNETFIFYGRQNGELETQSSAVVSACQAAGFDPHVGQVVPHTLSRLNLVAAGLGIAIVSASMKRMNVEGVAFRRLKRASQLRVPLNIASRRSDTSEVVRQFLKLAKRTATG